jgi:hypothetical protein
VTVLAGFDYVTEISNAAITKLFKSHVTIADVALNPRLSCLCWVDAAR